MAKRKKKEILVDKEKILKNVEETHLKVKDIDINKLIPNVIDDVLINVYGDSQELYIPDNMSGDKFKRWLQGRGGIFSKDTNRWNKEKSYGRYIILKDNDVKTIARIIEDHELEAFEFLHLIHGKIKDVPYMILKKVDNNKSLTETLRYIEKNTNNMDDKSEVLVTDQIASSKDEANYSSQNLLQE